MQIYAPFCVAATVSNIPDRDFGGNGYEWITKLEKPKTHDN
jgi:hypothetical protein